MQRSGIKELESFYIDWHEYALALDPDYDSNAYMKRYGEFLSFIQKISKTMVKYLGKEIEKVEDKLSSYGEYG